MSSQRWRDIVLKDDWAEWRLSVYRSNLTYGALLREFRLISGVSQREVAKRLHVSSSAVSSWESGRASIPSYREAAYRRAVIAATNIRSRKAA